MTDAPALDVLELEKARRSTHRCDSHDDVQASPIGVGARGSRDTGQLGREQVERMSSAEIVQAQKEGA
jgi:hypothetical protein